MPLYDYARKGIPLPRPIEKRQVTAHSLELVEWKGGDHPYRWPEKAFSDEQKRALEQSLSSVDPAAATPIILLLLTSHILCCLEGCLEGGHPAALISCGKHRIRPLSVSLTSLEPAPFTLTLTAATTVSYAMCQCYATSDQRMCIDFFSSSRSLSYPIIPPALCQSATKIRGAV
jgi:hypothetical protein